MCFFTKDLSAAVVISPFSQFMAASSAHVGDTVAYGAQGSITSFPAGYSLSFIVSLEDSPGTMHTHPLPNHQASNQAQA